MSSNDRKTPLARSLNMVATERAQQALQLLGKALPAQIVQAQGAIVQVSFLLASPFVLPLVTMPLGISEYVRLPVQPGDKGVVYPSDFYLGGASGLGGGTAGLGAQGNLSTLVFFPIGNSAFQAVDPAVLTCYGPSGVTLRDQQSNTVVRITPTGITITLPSGGNVVVTGGDVIADGISLKTHIHPGVATGGGITGLPI
jgi:hypothetical protein